MVFWDLGAFLVAGGTYSITCWRAARFTQGWEGGEMGFLNDAEPGSGRRTANTGHCRQRWSLGINHREWGVGHAKVKVGDVMGGRKSKYPGHTIPQSLPEPVLFILCCPKSLICRDG